MFKVTLGNASDKKIERYDRIAINTMVDRPRIIFKNKAKWLVVEVANPASQKALPELLKQLIEEGGESELNLQELHQGCGFNILTIAPNDPRLDHPLDHINMTSCKYNCDTYKEWGRNRDEQIVQIRYYLEIQGEHINDQIEVLAEAYFKGINIPLPQDIISHYLNDRMCSQYGYEEFIANCGYEDTSKSKALFNRVVKSVQRKDKALQKHIPVLQVAFQDY